MPLVHKDSSKVVQSRSFIKLTLVIQFLHMVCKFYFKVNGEVEK